MTLLIFFLKTYLIKINLSSFVSNRQLFLIALIFILNLASLHFIAILWITIKISLKIQFNNNSIIPHFINKNKSKF